MKYGIVAQMSDKLKELIQRAENWPEEAKKEAIESLEAIEEDFVLDAKTRAELDRAHAEAARGEGATLEEIKERYGI